MVKLLFICVFFVLSLCCLLLFADCRISFLIFRVKNISFRDPHAVEESTKGSKPDMLISSKVCNWKGWTLLLYFLFFQKIFFSIVNAEF